jgi:hypothetical protein
LHAAPAQQRGDCDGAGLTPALLVVPEREIDGAKLRSSSISVASRIPSTPDL